MGKVRLSSFIATIVVWLAAAGGDAAASSASAPGEVIVGSRMHTAAPNGTWRVWFDASGARIIAANSGAIWFAKGGSLWRYNIEAGRVDVAPTRLTLPDLNDFLLKAALSPDGRLAVSCGRTMLLWDGQNWVRLPGFTSTDSLQHLGFGKGGELWCAGSNFTFRWEGQNWSQPITVGRANLQWHPWNAVVNVGETYSSPASSQPSFPAVLAQHGFRDITYVTKGGVIGATTRYGGDKSSYFRIEPDKVVPLLKDVPMGCVDLGSGEVLRARAFSPDVPIVLEKQDGSVVVELPQLPPYEDFRFLPALLRDGRGDYWCGFYRLEGKQWKPVIPAHAILAGGHTREAVASGRFRYDEQRQTWVDEMAGQIPDARGYNAQKRTAWRLRFEYQEPDRTAKALQYSLLPSGSVEQVQSAKIELRNPIFDIIEESGSVWFDSACRWDGQSAQRYYDGDSRHRTAENGMARLIRDRSGGLWMYPSFRTWRRYNPQRDRFENADPREAFAFEVAGRRFSVAGRPCDPGWDSDADVARVYVASPQWTPLLNTFVQTNMFPLNLHLPWALRFNGYADGMVRGDRMLLSCTMGVLEWDVARDRWAWLSPLRDCVAFYDSKGRCIILQPDRIGEILMYEGETMTPPATTAPATTSATDLEPRLRKLTDTMDAGSAIEAEAAAQEVLALLQQRRGEVRAIAYTAAAWKQYTPGTRSRLSAMLLVGKTSRQTQDDPEQASILFPALVGNSLMERMHPPLPVACDYIVRPGMSLEHADAVLSAAGALRSSRVSWGDANDHCGYLLRDGTLVYLTLDKPYTGTIVSMGFHRGLGFNPEWKWTAPDMAQSEIQLKPYTAFYGRIN